MTLVIQPDWPEWFINLRTHQAQAISEIMAGYNNGKNVVIMQAPTGSGKTVIAEYVRRLLNTKAVYTCTTKALQDQVLGAFPYAKVVKGRSNYPTEYFPLSWDKPWHMQISCGDCTGGYPDGLDCQYCEGFATCPYRMARAEASEAQLAVLNTSYYLNATKGRSPFKSGNFGLKIIDECDTLEAEMMRHVSVKITTKMQQKYDIPSPGKKTVESSWLGWTFVALERVNTAIMGELAHTAISDKDKRIKNRTLDSLRKLKDKLVKVNTDLQNTVMSGEKSWVYTGYDKGDVEFKPITVSGMGEDMLWSHSGRKLLMSGSVISPQVLADDLGIEDFHFVNVPSTFPRELRPVYFNPSGSMSRKNKDDTFPIMVKDIQGLVNMEPDVRIIVHTHSYSNSKVVYNELLKIDDIAPRLITYTSSAEKDVAIERFRHFPDGVIIASSLDRGYDFPHDMCRMQIICKVPAPYLGDKQVSARMYGTKGGKSWYAVQTIRSIVQMCGRGVRSEEDWCRTYILDSDFSRLWRERQTLFPEYFREALTVL